MMWEEKKKNELPRPFYYEKVYLSYPICWWLLVDVDDTRMYLLKDNKEYF